MRDRGDRTGSPGDGTQTVATVIAAVGILVTGIGWRWAAVVWLYALAWFVVNDQLKVLTYRLIGRGRPAS